MPPRHKYFQNSNDSEASTDTMSRALLGANVVGLDLAPESLCIAGDLAARCILTVKTERVSPKNIESA